MSIGDAYRARDAFIDGREEVAKAGQPGMEMDIPAFDLGVDDHRTEMLYTDVFPKLVSGPTLLGDTPDPVEFEPQRRGAGAGDGEGAGDAATDWATGVGSVMLTTGDWLKKYSDDQARDENGMWSATGAGTAHMAAQHGGRKGGNDQHEREHDSDNYSHYRVDHNYTNYSGKTKPGDWGHPESTAKQIIAAGEAAMEPRLDTLPSLATAKAGDAGFPYTGDWLGRNHEDAREGSPEALPGSDLTEAQRSPHAREAAGGKIKKALARSLTGV